MIARPDRAGEEQPGRLYRKGRPDHALVGEVNDTARLFLLPNISRIGIFMPW